MKRGILLVAVAGSLFVLGSCDNSSSNNKSDGKPIVLGDPATIVTETDSTYLRDLVADIRPSDFSITPDSIQSLTDSTKKADSIATPVAAPVQNGPGLTVAFKEVTVKFPGVSAKLAGKEADLKKSSGATYQLTDGKIDGNTLYVSGATISDVSMRYQTSISIKNELGILELDALMNRGDWKTIKGNNTYNINLPKESQLEIAKVTQGTLRSAINREAKQRRMNRKTQQQWISSVRKVRNAHQKPLDVSVRAVMFKIDGKDNAGRSFSKQIRIDL